MEPWLLGEAPFILSVPVVLFAAWFGGLGPAIVAALLGAVIGAEVLANHVHPPALSQADMLSLGLYALACAAVVTLAEAQRAAQCRADVSAAESAEAGTRWRVTLQSIGDAVVAVDTAGCVTFINPEAERLTGWSRHEAVGRPFVDCIALLHEATRQVAEPPLAIALRDGRIDGPTDDALLVSRDGVEHPIDYSAAPIRGADGRVGGAVMAFHDISARRAADHQISTLRADLERQVSELRTVLEVLPVGVGISDDRECTLVRRNAALVALLGLANDPTAAVRQLVDGPNVSHRIMRDGAVIATDDLPLHVSAERGEEVRDMPAVIVRGDGDARDVLMSSTPLRGPDGEVRGAVAVVIDTTERQNTERALVRARDEWERTFDSVPDLIAILDCNHRIVRANLALSRHLAREKDACVGLHCYRCMHATDEPITNCPHAATLKDGLPHQIEINDGAGQWLEVLTTPLLDEAGRLIGSVHVAHDITARKQLEEHLEQWAAELEHRVDERTAELEAAVAARDELLGREAQALADLRESHEALAESEANYRLLVQACPLPVGVVDRETSRFLVVNEAASSQFGYTEAEFGSMTTRDVRTSGARPIMGMPGLSAHGDGGFGIETRAFRRDGTAMDIEVIGRSIRFQGRAAWLVLAHDVTEQRQTAAAILRQNDEINAAMDELLVTQAALEQAHLAADAERRRYQDLFDLAPDCYLVTDMDGVIREANDAAQAILGEEAHGLIGRHLVEFATESSRADLLSGVEALRDGAGRRAWEARVRSGSHGAIHVAMSVAAARDRHGVPYGLRWIVRDVSYRIRAAAQLEHMLDEVHRLAQGLQSAREDERSSVAREIHDELGQSLTGLKLDLAWTLGRLSRQPPGLDVSEVVPRLEAMSELVDSTIGSVRRIATELRPPVLDALGLVATLDWLVRDFENRSGIGCTFTSDVDELALGRDCSTAVFRIIQEGLTNVARHSRATTAVVSLSATTDTIRLAVVDDGIGISASAAADSRTLGLLGMRERALVFGGHVSITGRPGVGTEVHVVIPCPCARAECPRHGGDKHAGEEGA